MPFALVPDGFELKKVTKLQKDAVDRYYRHENVKALIDNPEIIKQIIITGVALLAAREGKEALQELKELGATIPKTVEDAYTKKRDVGAPIAVSLEQVVEYGLERLGLKSDE
jgi:hypothetical protein